MFRQLFTICLVALIMSVSADTDPTTVAPDVKPVTVPTKAPTTSAPVTTTVAPVTTTVAPVTTTVEPVTTVAPQPQPLPPFPEPTQGNWSFSDPNTKQTCIILQFALQLNLTYNTADKKSNNVLYNIPSNATVASGSCANETDSIVLQWSGSNSLNLTFEKNVTASRYDLASLQIQLNASTLFNQTDDQIALFYKQPNTFVTPVKFSYYCNHEQVLNLTASAASNETVATLALNHVHLEAFHEASSVSYSTAKDCDAIDTPDIVPIAVGCALAALVVVVLIAYLVGRRRAQNRGYLSM